jgi:hypothetical protein
MVRRQTGDVFIWTPELSKRGDLEEVYAADAEEALKRPAMPNPDKMSLEEIEKMNKQELVIFAQVKLGLTLDVTKTKTELADLVKEHVLLGGPAIGVGPIQEEAGPFATARESLVRSGMPSKPQVKANASNNADQPVR